MSNSSTPKENNLIRHLTVRVAWHDNKWNGSICNNPLENPYCLSLDKIREARNDELEDSLKTKFWDELKPEQLPPCIADSGGFMNSREWRRVIEHPYQNINKAAATHGRLLPTTLNIPPYSTFAVPYAWMLRVNQDSLDESSPVELPPDEQSPFYSSWVFGRKRQETLLNSVFDKLTPERSLVFFYLKDGQPLGDFISRSVVGVGRILKVGKLEQFDSETNDSYPIWDRIITHSIRPNKFDGVLLPYHDYLKAENIENDENLNLLKEIVVSVDSQHSRSFSYAAEIVNPDVALSTLVKILGSLRKIQEHGIAEGKWKQHEDWVNEQIAIAWTDRGAFPGVGAALEAIGMRLGTALALELLSSGKISSSDNPWEIIDALIQGRENPPQSAYKADLEAVKRTWIGLSEERRSLLYLLSRFDLTPNQAKRIFDEQKRATITQTRVSDGELLTNPYRITEIDLGDGLEPPISMSVIDRGLMPDITIAANHPVPQPSKVESPNDERRVRAGLVSILKEVSEQGDSLLSTTETIERAEKLKLAQPFAINTDWLNANAPFLSNVIETIEIKNTEEEGEGIAALQLSELKIREERLEKILLSRTNKNLPSLNENWSVLIKAAIEKSTGGSFDESNQRHLEALKEQASALEKITTRKLSVLSGRAGTGKTSVLGALLQSKQLLKDGILLLAPTGKARVRLGRVAGAAEAMTVAQFLYRCKRYDALRQRPLFKGEEKYRKEKTLVIDECSMLTMNDLLAVFEATDLAHVQRIILVGDPNQLPPIGVGRPFADLVAYLEQSKQSENEQQKSVGEALGQLKVEVRASAGAPSDTLRLASWFTREPQPVDADSVLSELELNASFNDLEICFWENEAQLRERLLEQFQKHLGLTSAFDVNGFNKALGINEQGFVPYNEPDNAEYFQILSPVRMHPHGVYELNRWIQRHFRKKELENARKYWGLRLGDEEIVVHDKVIQVANRKREGYKCDVRGTADFYIANGEIGVASSVSNKTWMKVIFSGRPNVTFSYNKYDFPNGFNLLELAYALTVHKAQGSEFKKVFVVIPKSSLLVSRELLYTALTRSRDKLVLLIEGKDASVLFDFTRPEKSETIRRNTNLIKGAVRQRIDTIPFANHLIHRTEKGEMVRSKSELVIANMLYRMEIDYMYERPVEGEIVAGIKRPDFSFVDPSGDLILWEHLGMLNREDYRMAWKSKLEWYEKNNYKLGSNLFTTEDDELGGLDSNQVKAIAEKIKAIL